MMILGGLKWRKIWFQPYWHAVRSLGVWRYLHIWPMPKTSRHHIRLHSAMMLLLCFNPLLQLKCNTHILQPAIVLFAWQSEENKIILISSTSKMLLRTWKTIYQSIKSIFDVKFSYKPWELWENYSNHLLRHILLQISMIVM